MQEPERGEGRGDCVSGGSSQTVNSVIYTSLRRAEEVGNTYSPSFSFMSFGFEVDHHLRCIRLITCIRRKWTVRMTKMSKRIRQKGNRAPKGMEKSSPLACSAFNCFSNPGRGSSRSARRENSSYGTRGLLVLCAC